MSDSKLVTYTRITSNKTVLSNKKNTLITIHAYVGQVTAKQGCDYFANSYVGASSNYVVGYDGSIGLSVNEKDRAWTTGGNTTVNGISGSQNDYNAVTIEVACDTKSPYAVTDAAYKALIELVADICKRNGIKKLIWKADKSLVGKPAQQNMTAHRWFAPNKACPGDYLYSRFGDIANKVNAKLGATSTTPSSATTNTSNKTDTSATTYTVKSGDTLSEIADKYKTTVASLVSLNGIKDANKIYPGQVLKLKASASTPSSSSSKPSTSTSTSTAKTYTVKNGDTLSDIAVKYKTTVEKLVSLNGIKDKNKIYPGQVLKLPEQTSTASSGKTNAVANSKIKAGAAVSLSKKLLYVSSSAKTASGTLTGTYYYWDDQVINGRIRVTKSKANVGKANQVTGWIEV